MAARSISICLCEISLSGNQNGFYRRQTFLTLHITMALSLFAKALVGIFALQAKQAIGEPNKPAACVV